jgi:hypothetical protein
MLLNYKYFCENCPADNTNIIYPAITSLEEMEDIIKNNHQVSVKYNVNCQGCKLFAVMVKNMFGIVHTEHKDYGTKGDNLITIINTLYEEIFGYFGVQIRDYPRNNEDALERCIIIRSSTTIKNDRLKMTAAIVTKDEFLNIVKDGTLLSFSLYVDDIDEDNNEDSGGYDTDDFLKDKGYFETLLIEKSLHCDIFKSYYDYKICIVKGVSITKPSVK